MKTALDTRLANCKDYLEAELIGDKSETYIADLRQFIKDLEYRISLGEKSFEMVS